MASCPQRKFRFSSSTWSCPPASWPLASSGYPSSARTRNALALGGPPLPSSPPPRIPVPDGAPAPASVPNPPARYNVFKIHWLMAALAFTKSVSLLLHSVSAWVWSREVRLGPRGQGSSAEQLLARAAPRVHPCVPLSYCCGQLSTHCVRLPVLGSRCDCPPDQLSLSNHRL